jgi:predicted NAD/FAD-dependent oxidoreductase
MGKQDEFAKFIRQVRAAGLDVGNGCVVADGVFSESLQFARVFAKTHDKDLVRVDGQISGWLARNKSRKSTGKRRS